MNQTVCAQTSGFIAGDGYIQYQHLSQQFVQHHQTPLNVGLHFATTPLGVLGALCLLKRISGSTSLVATLLLVYCASLLSSVSVGSYLGTVLMCGVLLVASRMVLLNVYFSVALIGLAYLMQDAAHFATGEKTMQSSYTAGPGQFDLTLEWFNHFAEHTYYLVPLCFEAVMAFLPPNVVQSLSTPLPSNFAQLSSWIVVPLMIIVYGSYCLDSKNRFCFFPGLPTFQRVLMGDLYASDGAADHQSDIQLIRKWVMTMCPSDVQSTHYWFWALPVDVKECFHRCAHAPAMFDMFRSLFSKDHYCVDVVEGMNEIYVTGPERFDEGPNSDQIFDMRHVDGPWGVIPFVSVYRCLIGMDRNHVVKTMCPFPNITTNLTEGKVMGFDFNREVHYIARDPSKQDISDKFRVTLKCHYCVYPRILAPLGWFMHWVNVRYNRLFRALFLATIQPVSLYDKMMAYNVTINTTLMDLMESYVGEKNIFYLLGVALVAYLCDSYSLFLIMTSYVHYSRYITTYAVQKSNDVDFGSWKRDALLFKTLSIGQLGWMYLNPTIPFEWDVVSVVMIVTGYAVSMMATKKLGVDRTYFGAELGVVPPKWVDSFPYGYIPHPMILSQIWALLGFYRANHIRNNEYPWLIPVHIAFYLTHLLQEQFGVYLPESYFKR